MQKDSHINELTHLHIQTISISGAKIRLLFQIVSLMINVGYSFFTIIQIPQSGYRQLQIAKWSC